MLPSTSSPSTRKTTVTAGIRAQADIRPNSPMADQACLAKLSRFQNTRYAGNGCDLRSFNSRGGESAQPSPMAYRPLNAGRDKKTSATGGGPSPLQYESVEFVSYSARFNKEEPRRHVQRDDSIDGLVRHRRLFSAATLCDRMIALAKWLMTALIGACTAHIAVLISVCTTTLLAWKFDTLDSLLFQEKLGEVPAGMGVLFFIACNALWVATASLLTTFWAPSSAGSGIPEIKSTLNGVHVKAWMSIETLICKIIGVILSVSSGLPVGKEGPMIHSGAIVAAFFAQKRTYQCFGWRPVTILHEKDVRDLVTCGAVSGVAAAFGAPIGGVLFALEEGASFLSPTLIWRAFFCAMVSTFVVFGSTISSFSETAKKSTLFVFGRIVDPSVDSASYMPWELAVFVAIGAAGGVVGAAFIHLNKTLMFKVRVQRLAKGLKVTYVVMLAIVLSVAWFYLPLALGTCQPVPPAIESTAKSILTTHLVQYKCATGHYNDLASLLLAPQETALKQLLHLQNPAVGPPTFTTQSLIAFAVFYFMGTACVFGASITSGVFVPSIVVGAALGRIVGRWMHMDDLDFINISTYALVGAAAVLGGVTRMTISLTVILLEATGDLQYALPIMMALLPARWVGNLLSEGLYDTHIRCRGIPFLDWNPPKGADRHVSVTEILKPDPVLCFGKRERVGTILAALEGDAHDLCWPVVERCYDPHSGTHDQFLEGTIHRHVLISLLRQKSTWNPFFCNDDESDLTDVQLLDDVVEEKNAPPLDASKFSADDKACFVNLELYVNPSPVVINGAREAVTT
ncbi:Aste57867_12826 [Aphanomyces stellatus]|uniref:Aste57867_12826 protein n=1 Tax=Aphanomyces stellatus TaxID=120398 RepID=A0A485KX91_9STRA|nr:hypothetical protein As57867_012778 [Aphanomyces stellatus]VFT89673.1 Aste57867_12826 [Aphanomyces stellatus]